MTINKIRKVAVPQNSKVLNCLNCLFTYHFPCETKDSKCIVMNDRDSDAAVCLICPSHCSWKKHALQDVRYEVYQHQETHTHKELQRRYEQARDRSKTSQNVIEKIREDVSKMQQDVIIMIKQARECIAHLNEIAFKPGSLLKRITLIS